jgi:hypothetical protein
MTNDDEITEANEEWFRNAELRIRQPMTVREAGEFRELWFIYSPVAAPWANLRVATFSKAINPPHLDLVVIHNEWGPRLGMRVWDDIVKSEYWIKVRQIDVPSSDEVKAAYESGQA